MHANLLNTATERQCHRCRQVLAASPENFLRDKSRPLGLAYECKSCHRERKAGRDRRTERWANLSEVQRDAVRERRQRYGRTAKGRAWWLANAYRRIDDRKGHECDIDQDYLLSHIFTKACVYCGTTDQLGCDRIDNRVGHTKANVVPACGDCNVMRGDRFSHEEMLVIGEAVARVRSARSLTEAQSEDRQETTCSAPHS